MFNFDDFDTFGGANALRAFADSVKRANDALDVAESLDADRWLDRDYSALNDALLLDAASPQSRKAIALARKRSTEARKAAARLARAS